MTDLERIGHLMAELGREFDAEAVTEYDGTTWAINVDAYTLVLVELEATQNLLTFSVDLGKPEGQHKNDTYQAALISNYVAPQGDAARIALDGVDGSLVLMQSLAIRQLDLDSLRGSLSRLLEQARPWREILIHGGVSTEIEDPHGTILESLTGLRV